MEKLDKTETLDDQLDQFKNYGFNVDELIKMLNKDETEVDDSVDIDLNQDKWYIIYDKMRW